MDLVEKVEIFAGCSCCELGWACGTCGLVHFDLQFTISKTSFKDVKFYKGLSEQWLWWVCWLWLRKSWLLCVYFLLSEVAMTWTFLLVGLVVAVDCNILIYNMILRMCNILNKI